MLESVRANTNVVSGHVLGLPPVQERTPAFIVDAMLRAVVRGDQLAFNEMKSVALESAARHGMQRQALCQCLSEALRSGWAAALAQGSNSQRELLVDMLCLHGNLEAATPEWSSASLVDAFGAGQSHRRAAVRLPAWGRRGRPTNHADPLLSAREVDVVKAVADGLTNKQIAQRLSLSPNTVKRHVTRVMHRLGLHARAAIASWYTSEVIVDGGRKAGPAIDTGASPA